MKLAELVGSDRDPLQYICDVAADPEQPATVRLHAATVALPYLHPRLSASAVAVSRTDTRNPTAALETLLARFARIAPPPEAPVTIEGDAVLLPATEPAS